MIYPKTVPNHFWILGGWKKPIRIIRHLAKIMHIASWSAKVAGVDFLVPLSEKGRLTTNIHSTE